MKTSGCRFVARGVVGLSLLVASCASTGAEGGFYRTEGARILGPDGRAVILRGMGLGGWLMPEGYMLRVPGRGSPTAIRRGVAAVVGEGGADRYFALYHENYVRQEDVAKLAEWGFDHVRLPFHYDVLWDAEAGRFREDGFALFDRLLGWCRAHGLGVILDLHAAPGGQNPHNIADADGRAELWVGPDAAANQALTVRIWAEVARRYADEPLIIGYDLLNEPVLPRRVRAADLRAFYVRLRDAIRAVDPRHILFVEGDDFARDFRGLPPAFDENMVWAFHKYWTPTAPESFEDVLALRDTTGVPIWLGEAGENSNDWFHEVVRFAEANEIGWTWWPHKKVETVTSPLSAPMPSGYHRLVERRRGRAARPDTAEALAVLLAQAAALHVDSATFRPDVIRALFDPAWSERAAPFRAHILPGTIAAVDYDLGADGVAYHDTESKNESGSPGLANEGRHYRNDGVDIARRGAPGAPPYTVGWIEDGEWLQYTVTVAEAGRYDVVVHVAAGEAGGAFGLLLDGTPLAETLPVPATGGGRVWAEVRVGELPLPAGTHTLRFVARRGGFNLSHLTFARAAPHDG